MVSRTLVSGDWVVAHDGESHVLLRDGQVLVEDERVTWIGRGFAGDVDRRIVIPGLLDMHSHAAVHTGELVVCETGRPDLYNSGILSFLPTRGVRVSSDVEVTDEEYLTGSKLAFAEMLRAGATTVVEAGCLGASVDTVGGYAERFVDVVEEVGCRAWLSPGFCGENQFQDEAGRIVFEPAEDGGFGALERAVRFIERFAGAARGRVQGMLFPNVDLLCSRELLEAAVKEAERLDVRMQTHCSEALLNQQECLRRHRMSLVEYLADCGWLGPRAILGHALYSSEHPWVVYPQGRDLDLMAASGCTVVHCPTVFARRGAALHSFQRYLDAGINLCLGTDTFPMDIIAEMRHAAYVGRVVDGDVFSTPSRALFDAVTVNAARALGRDDIGRLAPGTRADVVVVDVDRIEVGPYIDPIRTLVNCVSGRDVESVLVDGELVVHEGRLTRLDQQALLAEARRVTERDLARIAAENWPGRPLDEVAPTVYRQVDGL